MVPAQKEKLAKTTPNSHLHSQSYSSQAEGEDAICFKVQKRKYCCCGKKRLERAFPAEIKQAGGGLMRKRQQD